MYIHGTYIVYYILHPVAGVVEEGRGAGARLPTCGAAPTYCHAGTATRARTRARPHVRAHPSARAPCGTTASANTEVANEIKKWWSGNWTKSGGEEIPELLNDQSKLCMPAVPTVLFWYSRSQESKRKTSVQYTPCRPQADSDSQHTYACTTDSVVQDFPTSFL